MDARCQCGSVRFRTPTPKPLALYICHCSDCRRQTGSAFGTSAIFPRFKLPDDELLACYARPTSSGVMLYCYFCRKCGTRLIHSAESKNVVSVKGGCLEGLDWKTAIHLYTNSAMVPIPEGSETHSEDSPGNEYAFSGYADSEDSGSVSTGAGAASATKAGNGTAAPLDKPDILMGNGTCHLLHE